MKEYRITVVLKSEHEARSRINSYTCDCFRELIDVVIAFNAHHDTLAIRVDEIETKESDISDLFSKLDKIYTGEEEEDE